MEIIRSLERGAAGVTYPCGCSNFHLSPAALLSCSHLFPCWTDRWHSKKQNKKKPNIFWRVCRRAGRREWEEGMCECVYVCVCARGGAAICYIPMSTGTVPSLLLIFLFFMPFAQAARHRVSSSRGAPALVDPRVSSCYSGWQLYEPRRIVRPYCGKVKVCKMANICNSTPPPRNVPVLQGKTQRR